MVGLVHGHVAAWHKGDRDSGETRLIVLTVLTGMYCLNGTTGEDNPNTSDIVTPLFNVGLICHSIG